MIKITFQKETFLLTDKEFEEANNKYWKKNAFYYCQRLKATISNRFQFASPPKNELNFKIWVYKHKNNGIAKLFEQNGVFFKEVNDNEKIEIKVDEEFKKKLIDQERFYEMGGNERKAFLIGGK